MSGGATSPGEDAGPGLTKEADLHPPTVFERVAARALGVAEDVVYAGIGVILLLLSIAILVSGILTFVRDVGEHAIAASVVLLSTSLLSLIVVELLYTVVVWLRDHVLRPDPFLIVAITAAVRRILLITAQEKLGIVDPESYRLAMLELGLLTVLVVGFTAVLIALRRARPMAG